MPRLRRQRYLCHDPLDGNPCGGRFLLAGGGTRVGGNLRHLLVPDLCLHPPPGSFSRERGRPRPGIFRQLLEHRWLRDADREKGRLRAFLVTALKHFMAKEWRHAVAEKRGGGRTPLSIDAENAETRYASTARNPSVEAEALFDREWALTLLELTMKRLANEYADAGKSERFDLLKEGLFSPHQDLDYPALAESLNLGVPATQVAVHRLRKRFRELYRLEVAQTLPAGMDLEDEIRYLGGCLARM